MKNWFGVLGQGPQPPAPGHRPRPRRAGRHLPAHADGRRRHAGAARQRPGGRQPRRRAGRGRGRRRRRSGAPRRLGRGAARARPAQLGFIAEAEQRGLGRGDLALVKELGTDVSRDTTPDPHRSTRRPSWCSSSGCSRGSRAGRPARPPLLAFFHGRPARRRSGVTLRGGTLPGALVWARVADRAHARCSGASSAAGSARSARCSSSRAGCSRPRSRRESLQVNRYRRWYALKYYILAGAPGRRARSGRCRRGLLDPLSLTARGLASGALAGAAGRPAGAGRVAGGGAARSRSWWRAAGSRASSAAPSVRWARSSASSRASRSSASTAAAARLHQLRACARFACQGADEPLGAPPGRRVPRLPQLPARLPRARDRLPARCRRCRRRRPKPDLSRRYLVGTRARAPGGRPAAARRRRRARGGARRACIRPPGALAEAEFLERCVKCSLCQQACPTGALQPAIAQAGRRGVLDAGAGAAPRLVRVRLHPLRRGLPHRRHRAARRGAQDRLRRPAAGEHRHRVRRPRPLPARGRWAPPASSARRCARPTPRRSGSRRVEEPGRDGAARTAAAAAGGRGRAASGCGICENSCPVGEEAAIRVTSVGETRDPLNRMLLGS